jgi:cell division protein FtsW
MSQATSSFQLHRARLHARAEAAAATLDLHLVLPTLLLVAFGIVMVFSASYPKVLTFVHPDAYYFLKRQIVAALLGVLVFIVARSLRIKLIYSLAYPFFFLALGLLFCVLFIGHATKGATSWFSLGPIKFQPSEMAKIALMLALARYLSDHPQPSANIRQLLPAFAMIGLVCGMVVLGNDFGTAAVTGVTAFVLLFLGGAPMRHLVKVAVLAVCMASLLIFTSDNRKARIVSFVNPGAYLDSGGYQINRCMIAFGSGGPFGLGFSQSREKFFYLPEPHTDSILAIVGEELGLLACLAIIALFAWIGWRGLRVTALAREHFQALLAVGMTSIIILSASTNILVTLGMVPNTGLPLPFISYGGSSLIFSLFAVGLIANVSRYAEAEVSMKERGEAQRSQRATADKSPERATGTARAHSLRPRGM